LTAIFTRDTGVDIIIDGEKPIHLQGVKGEELKWEAGKSLRLVFDQPDSATLTVNDAKVAFPTRRQNGKLTLAIPVKIPKS